MRFKIRLKYTLSIGLIITATIMNFLNIQIQDNWVSIVKWILLAIFGGFTVKTIKDYQNEKQKF